MSEKIECRACGRAVDSHARMCPYCAADPRTGEIDDSRPEIETLIPPKPERSAVDTIMSAIRERSGLLLASSIIIGVALLIVISTWVNQRQLDSAADVPPVPLTEVTDLSATREGEEQEEMEIPEIGFEFGGDASRMEIFTMEEGAVPPPAEEEDIEATTEGERPNAGE